MHSILSEITLGFQQERWPSWNTSENRIVAYWGFFPFSNTTLHLGYSYRAPQYGASFLQSLAWPSMDGEFGLLYRIEVDVIQLPQFKLSLLVFDYDRMRLYTWTNIHFSIQPQYQISKKWKLQALLGVAAEGASGGIVSWDQNYINIGVAYGTP
jgi:hypothetical protein